MSVPNKEKILMLLGSVLHVVEEFAKNTLFMRKLLFGKEIIQLN